MDDIGIHVSFERKHDVPFKEWVKTERKKHWLTRKETSTPIYRDRPWPALSVHITFSEVAKHWIKKLKLEDYTVAEAVMREYEDGIEIFRAAQFKTVTLSPFLYNNPQLLHRENERDLNILQDEIVERLKKLKAIIESHVAPSPSSYDI